MDLRAILFDVNGTLIDIETDEGQDAIYRAISRFLTYQGAQLPPETIRDRYFGIMDEQRKRSAEQFPEFDAVAIWNTLLQAAPATTSLPAAKRQPLPQFLAELHRSLSHKRLQLYPDVLPVVRELGQSYALGIVTDAQSAYAVPELKMLGLGGVFASIIVSGDYGYRKPDRRLFDTALKALAARPEQAIYVGNDMYHDVWGAQQAGLRTVFFPTQYGRKAYENTAADYIIYSFAQVREAVAFLAAR